MAQIPAIKCGYCKKAVADLYCDDCHQVLCVKCRQDVHDKVPGFKGHKVANIQKEGNRVFKPHPVCETHKKQFLCYCRKCECLTCAECMTSNHNEHKTEKIKSVADTCRQTVNQIIEKIKTKVEIAKKKIETIDNKFSVQIKSDCESYVATVTKTTGELHEITDRYKRIHLTTASDFEYIEKQDLEKKRTFFKRRHNETNDRLLKFENLLQETHDSTFLSEWKALQTDVQMNDEETDDLLAVPRRIESFNQTKLTKSVIDEIDEKFQMRLSREVEEKEKKVNELLEENEKLKTELKGRQQQEFSKLQENSKAVTKFEEEKTKLTDELKLKQDEIRTLSNEVHTNADKTNKLTINFEDRIRELERKLKESEKKNTSKLQTDKGLQYALTGCNTTNESDNQLTESDLNKNGADRFSKLSTETDTLKTLKLNQLQFCVLQNLDFISFLNKENPTCNAKMNKNAITFIDTQRVVEKQMQIFFDYCIDTECLKNVQGKPTQIPERMLELAQRENIREYINKKLEIEAILCYWYSDRDEGYIKLFTLKGKGSKAVAVVQRCLDWEKITRSPAFDEVLKEKSMVTFINDHKANMIFDIHEKDLVVIGLKSGVRNFVELINRISEAHTKYEQTLILNRQKEITVLSSNILQHLRKFHSKEIEKFERKWNVFFKEENEAVLLQGVASDVQRASESLKDSSFIEQKWSCHVDNPVDVIKDLSSKSIPKLENQFCSSVFTDVNTSCISHQQLAQWVSQTKDQHIVFVHGSVTAMAADVIVYPVTKGEEQHRLGKIGKAIVTDGGCVMQGVVKEISRLEEIVITSSTGNLPCLMVAYFPVPFFKPEVQIEKEMVTRIQDILTEVAKTQLQSVVITTDIGNDIPESTFLRWFLLAYKACQYKLQYLNQIFLCIESEKISPLMDVLNDGLSNFLTLFDFTTMFEQRSPGISVTRKPADISIVIVNGKLVDQKVDILVNSSNRNLELEKGAVSASILEAGGERIYAECKQFYPNGISYGQVITTSPGNLRCKAICHGCLPHWKPIADISMRYWLYSLLKAVR
ncbi:putative leucine-rich repeat-containing protein DDB_G0290503 [Mytilus edulis]|uniref:putative leucine-rich repeat-containing protein DDB_G0290503 n=1 Tax=Mytilus edulis TaxID=6550 RepID=UPI0039F14A54